MATMLSLYYYVLLDLFKGLKNQENKVSKTFNLFDLTDDVFYFAFNFLSLLVKAEKQVELVFYIYYYLHFF